MRKKMSEYSYKLQKCQKKIGQGFRFNLRIRIISDIFVPYFFDSQPCPGSFSDINSL